MHCFISELQSLKGQNSKYMTPSKSWGSDAERVRVRTKVNHWHSRWKFYTTDISLHFDSRCGKSRLNFALFDGLTTCKI